MAKTIGNYEILEIIGDGGMGTVYRARDPRFDREVAIKVLHEQFQRDPAIVDRFTTEAVIQAKLSHPHIVTVLDFIANDGVLAFVMEYVRGKPLDAMISESADPIPLDVSVRITTQLLSAIGHAHSNGLVHRDIKPSNVMVQMIGGEEYAKVMDFGIAKILGAEKARTAANSKMGTLAYMSPEQIKSPRYVDARADIYSLGATLYEMLSGEPPFDADTEFALMEQIISQRPRPLHEIPALPIPPSLKKVLFRAMEKDPDKRYQNCDSFRADLLAAVSTPVVAGAAAPSNSNYAPPPAVEYAPPPTPTTAAAGPEYAPAAEAVAPPEPVPVFGQSGAGRAVKSGGAQKAWYQSPPVLVVLGLIVPILGILLYFMMGKSATETGFETAMGQGWLIKPLGQSAYDFYLRAKADKPGSSMLERMQLASKGLVRSKSNSAFQGFHDEGELPDGETWETMVRLQEWEADLYGDSEAGAKLSYAKGRVALSRKDYPGGISLLREALQAKPGWSLATNAIAIAYVNTDDWETAAFHYNQAASQEPGWVYPYLNLGGVYMHLKRMDEAQFMYEKAIAISPQKAIAHYWLGVVHQSRKMKIEACSEYSTAMQMAAGDKAGFDKDRLRQQMNRMSCS